MDRFIDWCRRRIRDPFLVEIKRGASPEGLAAAAAFGLVLSVVPVFGVTTGLCFFAGRVLRLNHFILQAVNFFMYPVQLLLIIPFLRFGEVVTRAEAASVLPSVLLQEFSLSPREFFLKFGMVVAHAALGWLLVAPLAIFGLNLALRWFFVKISSRISRKI